MIRIICDTQEEKDKLMEASKYLHDYNVGIKHKKKSTKVWFHDGDKWKLKNRDGLVGFGLDLSIDMVNFLAHLYNSGVVTVKYKDKL